MNRYIIYTTEGHTSAPNENVEVENCQVLGITNGDTVNAAKKNLIRENPWIVEAGYSDSMFVCGRLL